MSEIEIKAQHFVIGLLEAQLRGVQVERWSVSINTWVKVRVPIWEYASDFTENPAQWTGAFRISLYVYAKLLDTKQRALAITLICYMKQQIQGVPLEYYNEQPAQWLSERRLLSRMRSPLRELRSAPRLVQAAIESQAAPAEPTPVLHPVPPIKASRLDVGARNRTIGTAIALNEPPPEPRKHLNLYDHFWATGAIEMLTALQQGKPLQWREKQPSVSQNEKPWTPFSAGVEGPVAQLLAYLSARHEVRIQPNPPAVMVCLKCNEANTSVQMRREGPEVVHHTTFDVTALDDKQRQAKRCGRCSDPLTLLTAAVQP